MSESLSVQDALETLNINLSRGTPDQAPPASAFPYGNRIAMMGTPSAGKTTTVGGIVMRAEAKVAATAHTDTPFYCRTLERGSDIHQDVSNLRDGHFPAKTTSYYGFHSSAGLLLEWKRFISAKIPLIGKPVKKQLWHKLLQVPICDLPGETLTQVIRQVRAQTGTAGAIARRQIQTAINDMRESDGYIICIKASRAKGLGVQLEGEKDQTGLSQDPDVNLVRMLEDLMTYKSVNTGRPIKGVAVLITAWDKLKPIANRVGFDLLDPYIGQQNIENFVKACFPSTYSAIQSLRVPNVKYFPTFFQTETNSDGSEKTVIEGGYEGPKIITKDIFDPQGEWYQNARKISYSEQQFDELLNWLKDFAMAG